MFDNDPEASKVLKGRDVPKLGGSAAGFIVLIVVLCLIILISLISILVLLREDNASDEELQKKHRPKSTTYVTPEDEAGSHPSSWLRRTYQRLPFVRTGNTDRVPSIKLPRAPSPREATASPEHLHAESRDELKLMAPQPRYYNRNPHLERLGLHTSASTNPSIRRLSTPTTSSGSVRFEMAGMREIFPYERDGFAPSPTATLPKIHTQMSSPASSPASSPSTLPRRSRAEIPSLILPASVRHEQDVTRYSALTTTPSPAPPTFEGGSKFLEAL
ncbi:hypothetical protein AN958_11023 [Leucoagaricus sp. SymC.cos]|nr:hypothetical protein AN958_11023 [Leucoagaricus sp. SymC.cos]